MSNFFDEGYLKNPWILKKNRWFHSKFSYTVSLQYFIFFLNHAILCIFVCFVFLWRLCAFWYLFHEVVSLCIFFFTCFFFIKISIVHSGHHDCEICFTVSILSFMMSTVFFKLYICLLYMYVHLCMQIYQYSIGTVLSKYVLFVLFCILLHINHTILPARLMLTIENESNAMYR